MVDVHFWDFHLKVVGQQLDGLAHSAHAWPARGMEHLLQGWGENPHGHWTDREGERHINTNSQQCVFSSCLASWHNLYHTTEDGKGSTGLGCERCGRGASEDDNTEDKKFCKSQEGSVGSGRSIGMDGKLDVRFRKTERKTMRMEQLSIKSGNRVGAEEGVFERNQTKGDGEET